MPTSNTKTEWEKLESLIGAIPDFDAMSSDEWEDWAKKVNSRLLNDKNGLQQTTQSLLEKLGIKHRSIPLLITDSEAMKLVFGEELVSDDGMTEKEVELALKIANPGQFADDWFDEISYLHYAHKLLDLCLSGNYEAAEQLLVEALKRDV